MLPLLLGMGLIILAKLVSPAGYAPVLGLVLGMTFFNARTVWASLAMLLALFVSDLILAQINGTSFSGFLSGGMFLGYYALYVLSQLSGNALSVKLKSLVPGTLTAVLVFWLSSNLLTFMEGQLYLMTIDGFFNCYLQAIPFLLKSLVSNLAVTLVVIQVSKLLQAQPKAA